MEVDYVGHHSIPKLAALTHDRDWWYNFETKGINWNSTQGRKIWGFQFPASCTIPCKNLSFSVQPNVPIAFLFQYNKRWISLHGLAKPVTKCPKIVHLDLFSYNDKPQLLSYFSTTFTNEVLKLQLHGSKYFVKEIVRKLHIVTMWSWPEDDQDLGYCSMPSLALVVTCNTMPGLWKLESVSPFHLQNRATFVKQDHILRKQVHINYTWREWK